MPSTNQTPPAPAGRYTQPDLRTFAVLVNAGVVSAETRVQVRLLPLLASGPDRMLHRPACTTPSRAHPDRAAGTQDLEVTAAEVVALLEDENVGPCQCVVTSRVGGPDMVLEEGLCPVLLSEKEEHLIWVFAAAHDLLTRVEGRESPPPDQMPQTPAYWAAEIRKRAATRPLALRSATSDELSPTGQRLLAATDALDQTLRDHAAAIVASEAYAEERGRATREGAAVWTAYSRSGGLGDQLCEQVPPLMEVCGDPHPETATATDVWVLAGLFQPSDMSPLRWAEEVVSSPELDAAHQVLCRLPAPLLWSVGEDHLPKPVCRHVDDTSREVALTAFRLDRAHPARVAAALDAAART